MSDRARIGWQQKAILRYLDGREQVRVVELSYVLLDRIDVEAVRQVRRAVDALARRGLVSTWTGAVPGRQGRHRWVELARPWQREIDVDALAKVWDEAS
jgi:hypothetical protein